MSSNLFICSIWWWIKNHFAFHSRGRLGGNIRPLRPGPRLNLGARTSTTTTAEPAAADAEPKESNSSEQSEATTQPVSWSLSLSLIENTLIQINNSFVSGWRKHRRKSFDPSAWTSSITSSCCSSQANFCPCRKEAKSFTCSS